MTTTTTTSTLSSVEETLLRPRVHSCVRYWMEHIAEPAQVQALHALLARVARHVASHDDEEWRVATMTKTHGQSTYQKMYKLVQTYASEVLTTEAAVQTASLLSEERPSDAEVDNFRKLFVNITLAVNRKRGSAPTTYASQFSDLNFLTRREESAKNAHLSRSTMPRTSSSAGDEAAVTEIDYSKPVPPPTTSLKHFRDWEAPPPERARRSYSTKAPFAQDLVPEAASSEVQAQFHKFTHQQMTDYATSQPRQHMTTAALGRCLGARPDTAEVVADLRHTLPARGTRLEQLRALTTTQEPPPVHADSDSQSQGNALVGRTAGYFENLRKRAERADAEKEGGAGSDLTPTVYTRTFKQHDPQLLSKLRPKPFKPQNQKAPYDTQVVMDPYTTEHHGNFTLEHSMAAASTFR